MHLYCLVHVFASGTHIMHYISTQDENSKRRSIWINSCTFHENLIIPSKLFLLYFFHIFSSLSFSLFVRLELFVRMCNWLFVVNFPFVNKQLVVSPFLNFIHLLLIPYLCAQIPFKVVIKSSFFFYHL